jgi:hypothetical protein
MTPQAEKFVPAPSPRLRRAPSPVATGEGWGGGRHPRFLAAN